MTSIRFPPFRFPAVLLPLGDGGGLIVAQPGFTRSSGLMHTSGLPTGGPSVSLSLGIRGECKNQRRKQKNGEAKWHMI